MYVYCLSQTNCFVVSKLFRLTTNSRCFKLGSKSG